MLGKKTVHSLFVFTLVFCTILCFFQQSAICYQKLKHNNVILMDHKRHNTTLIAMQQDASEREKRSRIYCSSAQMKH